MFGQQRINLTLCGQKCCVVVTKSRLLFLMLAFCPRFSIYNITYIYRSNLQCNMATYLGFEISQLNQDAIFTATSLER
jgi:hypothetical protein